MAGSPGIDPHQNFAAGTVVTVPSAPATGTSLTLASGQGASFAVPSNASICPAGSVPAPGTSEVVRITAVSGDTLTIVRAQEGSTARVVQVGDQLYGGPTALSMTAIEGKVGSAMQNGVIGASDLLASAISVTGTTGAIQFTLAAPSAGQYAWVKATTGALLPVTVDGAAYTATPGTLPASGSALIVGIEISTTGALATVSGTSVAANSAITALTSPAVTSGRMRVADVAIYNSSGTYQLASSTTLTQGTNWLDRRPWARGAFNRQVYTSNAAASGGSGFSNVGTLVARLECSGVPVRFTLNAYAGVYVQITFMMDGSAVDGVTIVGEASSNPQGLTAVYVTTPPAGSHLFKPAFYNSGTYSLTGSATQPIVWTVEELVTANTNNGTV